MLSNHLYLILKQEKNPTCCFQTCLYLLLVLCPSISPPSSPTRSAAVQTCSEFGSSCRVYCVLATHVLVHHCMSVGVRSVAMVITASHPSALAPPSCSLYIHRYKNTPSSDLTWFGLDTTGLCASRDNSALQRVDWLK